MQVGRVWKSERQSVRSIDVCAWEYISLVRGEKGGSLQCLVFARWGAYLYNQLTPPPTHLRFLEPGQPSHLVPYSRTARTATAGCQICLFSAMPSVVERCRAREAPHSQCPAAPPIPASLRLFCIGQPLGARTRSSSHWHPFHRQDCCPASRRLFFNQAIQIPCAAGQLTVGSSKHPSITPGVALVQIETRPVPQTHSGLCKNESG